MRTDYPIGEDDWTTEEDDESDFGCEETDNYLCTRRMGHDGPHAAGTGSTVIEVWES